LALEVGIRIILPRPVVMVVLNRFVRSEFFEPDLVIVVKPALVVVDEDRRGAMRCPFVTC